MESPRRGEAFHQTVTEQSLCRKRSGLGQATSRFDHLSISNVTRGLNHEA
jgi:hypothetical protein